MTSKARGPEDFKLREAGDEDDVEGHGRQMREPEGAVQPRGPEDFKLREAGDEDDVEGHGRFRGGASTKGE
jgi:hypothetical protein